MGVPFLEAFPHDFPEIFTYFNLNFWGCFHYHQDHLDGAELGEVGGDAAEDGVYRVLGVVGGAAEAVLDVRVLPRLRQRRHGVQFAVQVGDLLGDVPNLDLVLRLL